MAQWETKTLATAAQLRPPVSEARRKLAKDASVSFVPMEDLGIDEKFLRPKQTRPLRDVAGSYTYFADGDLLLAKITPCFENGKLGIAGGLTNGVGFGSSEYVVLRPGRDLSPEWLYYYLSREVFRFEGAGQMAGAVGHRRVAKDFIENYPIPVPPIGDQQRIVGILDEAFAAIAMARANTEQNLHNARELFASYLRSIFAEAWRTSRLVTLSDLASDITDGDHMPPPKSRNGVPFVTIGNIVKATGRIDFSDTFMVPRAYFDALKENRRPKKGDVLYTVTGWSLGIPVHVDESVEFCFQRHIGLVRPKPGINSMWLYYLLLSPQVYRQADRGATGAAQRTVSLGLLRSLEVPSVGSAKQTAVVAVLNAIWSETERLASVYQRKLATLDALKQSLLHQAFTGAL